MDERMELPMKKSGWKLLPVLALCLLCLLLPLQAGYALTGADISALLGTRTYDVESLTTTLPSINATVGQIVDWLEDFIDDEAGNTLWMTNDLQDMLYLIEQDGTVTAAYPASTLADDKQAVLQAADAANAANAQMVYYYDRLSYAYERMQYIYELITNGPQTPDQQKELLVELTELYNEAKDLSNEAITNQGGWRTTISAAQNSLSAEGANHARMERIRNAAQPILHKEAAALAAQDAHTSVPVITVISDKEIGIGVTLPQNKTPNGITVKVTGGGTTKTTTTTSGAAVFWLADFKPDKQGRISVDVEISYNDYRTMWLGTIRLKGGGAYFAQMTANDGKPYVIGATINGWDMMHVQNGMFLSTKNDATHHIVVRVDCKSKPCLVLDWQKTGAIDWRSVLSPAS